MSIKKTVTNALGNMKPPKDPLRALNTIKKMIDNAAPKLELNGKSERSEQMDLSGFLKAAQTHADGIEPSSKSNDQSTIHR